MNPQSHPLDRLWTDEQLAEKYGHIVGSVDAIRARRTRGESWPVLRLGRQPLTDIDALWQWLQDGAGREAQR